ncbi:N-acetylglucosamine-6-phosphate deacetylase [Photobacterium sp. ZSDE20]|uniref:N-acetylglucosamine-6-phosphate deacetylase n=1 Tax=Photobacterium pectinilyticum TaxID=2906793 RepID=A0ABT1N9C8_9GAMM|nr:N-acetylglucosamine-6-phosphate deacetylase [Photobacterium sp. ZSDE20]MCQ1060717.1 N-acetylglucosamine-6-phosphate deacetylase [Photobacterium sp. ZSDE20]MDD1824099.1 N-acetylglucosamine-6-phosphate deacetylase [Photobacterium sp. ZSDE20]
MGSDLRHYRAARVLVSTQWLDDGVVSVDNQGTIVAIAPFSSFLANSLGSTERHSEVTDLGEQYLLPGLIDSHVHGAVGCDVMDASHESLNAMSVFFASLGVTGFVATTVTGPVKAIQEALTQVGKSRQHGVEGAELLGAYLEGPYFTEKNRGAHPTEWFRELSVNELDSWISYADNQLLTVALAPEKAGAIKAIKYLHSQGIKVMLGHSDASFDQVQQALNAGANGIVHCYNGMRGLHHRDPGVVGAGLCHPHSYVEMIADGHHVHPTAIDIAHRCCGERLTLITDAMRATNMPDGQYQLGEYLVNVNDGIATTDNGGLAGSTLTLPKAVFNLMQWLNLPLEQAWLRASLTPAQSLGLDSRYGSLEIGKQASMVALHPNQTISNTWVNGNLVFDADHVCSQEAVCI